MTMDPVLLPNGNSACQRTGIEIAPRRAMESVQINSPEQRPCEVSTVGKGFIDSFYFYLLDTGRRNKGDQKWGGSEWLAGVCECRIMMAADREDVGEGRRGWEHGGSSYDTR